MIWVNLISWVLVALLFIGGVVNLVLGYSGFHYRDMKYNLLSRIIDGILFFSAVSLIVVIPYPDIFRILFYIVSLLNQVRYLYYNFSLIKLYKDGYWTVLFCCYLMARRFFLEQSNNTLNHFIWALICILLNFRCSISSYFKPLTHFLNKN